MVLLLCSDIKATDKNYNQRMTQCCYFPNDKFYLTIHNLREKLEFFPAVYWLVYQGIVHKVCHTQKPETKYRTCIRKLSFVSMFLCVTYFMNDLLECKLICLIALTLNINLLCWNDMHRWHWNWNRQWRKSLRFKNLICASKKLFDIQFFFRK